MSPPQKKGVTLLQEGLRLIQWLVRLARLLRWVGCRVLPEVYTHSRTEDSDSKWPEARIVARGLYGHPLALALALVFLLAPALACSLPPAVALS